MTDAIDPHALLPPGLGAAVEVETGARLAGVNPRGGGGASREGAELTLAYPDGRRQRVYMNYDVHRVGAGDDAAFLREAAILRALSGPLADAGVRVAPFVAAIPDKRALLAGFAGGESNFNKLKAPAERSRVAADYMAQLAALHAIDAPQGVKGMGAPLPVGVTIADRIETLRARNAPVSDPLINLVLDWLEANAPPDPERLVIVHGDAGPGNFLYAHGGVTALLDWELVHFGDPMADLAMLALRVLFQPFVPLPEAFSAYEAAAGTKVDLERVRFWRLFFEVGFVHRDRLENVSAPPPNLGMNMIYSAIHRRVLAESFAEAAGVALADVALPEAPEGPHAYAFEIALRDLRDVIVPRLADQQAAVKAKGLARLVKWWRDIERYQPGCDALELTELAETLGEPFASVAEARRALAARVGARTIGPAIALRLCHAQATREMALMADAMGALAHARPAALT